MPGLYRNIGAPIRRDGVTVAKRNEVFAPTEDEITRLRYKLRLVDATPQAVGVSAPAAVAAKPRVPEPEPEPEYTGDISEYHTGAGWYTLPGGVRVRGKEAALEALGDADQD